MKGFLIAVGMLMLFGLVESLDKADVALSPNALANADSTQTATR